MRLFDQVLTRLEKHYGRPSPPRITDPFQMILHEKLAYLAPDEKRDAAFDALRDRVGLTPEAILKASPKTLLEITRMGGIHAELRAERLREAAHLTIDKFSGDLRTVLALPEKQARRALKQFPMIGDPGAEKILLFSKTVPVLALDSNGLRVLARILFGKEQKNYSTTYRLVREAVKDDTGTDCGRLITAHQLLRRHGQQLCKTTRPACPACPVADLCVFYRANA
jgi:endonuclease-3